MTSRLHKKHQITQQNIRPNSGNKLHVWVASVLMICLSAAFVAQAIAAEEGPLDRLRNRSTEKRWKSIRERFSDRRETRRDRKEKRQTTEAESKNTEKTSQQVAPFPNAATRKNSPNLLVPPAQGMNPASPLPVINPAWQKKNELRDLPLSPAATVREPAINQQKTSPIQLPLPVVEPSRAIPSQTNSSQTTSSLQSSARNIIQATPVTSTKTGPQFKTAFAPELPMPVNPSPSDPFGNKPAENSFSQDETPEETSNKIKSQRLQGEFDEIKSLNTISPFVDYEPDQKLRQQDPARHLCLLNAQEHGLVSNADVRCPVIETISGDNNSLYRDFAHMDYAWKATNTHSNPLYFEDPNLERYGHIHSPWIQPAASVGRFSVQLLGLPYQMAMQPVSKCVYPLGHFRPGDACTPKYRYRVPLNPWAALVTAEVYTGLFFLVP